MSNDWGVLAYALTPVQYLDLQDTEATAAQWGLVLLSVRMKKLPTAIAYGDTVWHTALGHGPYTAEHLQVHNTQRFVHLPIEIPTHTTKTDSVNNAWLAISGSFCPDQDAKWITTN